MKGLFRGSYRPTDSEFGNIWGSATFSFDTNVLLGFHRYSKQSTHDTFKLLDKLKGRLFLPHQVALEYHRHRPLLLESFVEDCERLDASFLQLKKKFQQQLEKYSRNPELATCDFVGPIDEAYSAIRKLLVTRKLVLETRRSEDLIGERLAAIFDGCVGAEPSVEELDAMKAEGAIRFARKTPPGYMDSKKGEEHRYDDYIIWSQILDNCKSESIDLIFVTNDQKEDWWLKSSHKILGPRPELIQEFHEVTGKNCWFYTFDRFFLMAHEHLGLKLPSDSANDIAAANRERDQLISKLVNMKRTGPLIPIGPSDAPYGFVTSTESHPRTSVSPNGDIERANWRPGDLRLDGRCPECGSDRFELEEEDVDSMSDAQMSDYLAGMRGSYYCSDCGYERDI